MELEYKSLNSNPEAKLPESLDFENIPLLFEENLELAFPFLSHLFKIFCCCVQLPSGAGALWLFGFHPQSAARCQHPVGCELLVATHHLWWVT